MEKINKFDPWLVISMTGALVMGLLAVYSATHSATQGPGETGMFFRQLSWTLVGALVVGVIYFTDYRLIRENSYIMYGAGILLLLAVLVFGRKVAGQTSWVRFGMFSFQPSELTKMVTIIALARFLSDDQTDMDNPLHLLISLCIPLVPAALVLMQPDTGTTLTCLSFVVPMVVLAGFNLYSILVILVPIILLLSGFFNFTILMVIAVLSIVAFILIRKKAELHQFIITGAGLAGGLLTWKFTASILRPHQIKRIQIFLDPMSDPRGAGYNALQSKIAIASGGLTGKGFLQGTQTQLRYIPAQWTDFIFCVIAEELGLIGSTLLLVFFMILILRLVWMVGAIKNKFVELVLAGYATLLMTHVFINIGMTIGLMPVIGVPLPFVSYGGSSIVANMMMVALAMNFFRNRRNIGY
ncbi:MAG: rod shape-determining protein RodA [Chlorobiaceae bacterium]|nr:rod shape-determining protein RodA [Chlorobiaceae bacterium]NTW73999.1 rod shape-determining protein RodA [Chlorobiaceae bacterium]